MKSLNSTFFLFLMSLSLVVFNSCEKEDGEKTASDLIGTWTFDAANVDAKVGGISLTTFLMNTLEMTEEQAGFLEDLLSDGYGIESGTITFKDDNTYQLSSGSEAENGSWSVSSDGKTLTLSGVDEDMTEYTDNITIVSLSSTQLVLSLPVESEEVDLDDDGTNETTIDFVVELTLSK